MPVSTLSHVLLRDGHNGKLWNMAGSVREYEMAEINRAGEALRAVDHYSELGDELEVVNNWRSCHDFPLRIVANTLSRRANSTRSQHALVARRIKRLPSIHLKLLHNPTMRLGQMQDIGGCRAVMRGMRAVGSLLEIYESAARKNPHAQDRHVIASRADYIMNPKADGYRSIHLIVKYQSRSRPEYNGQRVEIQIRTAAQHAWATAVETCQAFTGQALKSKIKTADATWIRFFALMSSSIARRENLPLVPDTPVSQVALRKELRELVKTEGILTQLLGWSFAMRRRDGDRRTSAAAYLLELDISKRMVAMSPYRESELQEAHQAYLAAERSAANDPAIQVVLVSADSVAALKRAYPNYYVDTSAFARSVERAMAGE